MLEVFLENSGGADNDTFEGKLRKVKDELIGMLKNCLELINVWSS